MDSHFSKLLTNTWCSLDSRLFTLGGSIRAGQVYFNIIHRCLIIMTFCYSLPLFLMLYKDIYHCILHNHTYYYLKTRSGESMVIWGDLNSWKLMVIDLHVGGRFLIFTLSLWVIKSCYFELYYHFELHYLRTFIITSYSFLSFSEDPQR